jgi:hypothetical protein
VNFSNFAILNTTKTVKISNNSQVTSNWLHMLDYSHRSKSKKAKIQCFFLSLQAPAELFFSRRFSTMMVHKAAKQ